VIEKHPAYSQNKWQIEVGHLTPRQRDNGL